jgi:hypothetical protein
VTTRPSPADFALLLTLSTAQFMMEEGSLRPVESPSAKCCVTVVRKLVTIRSAGAAGTESFCVGRTAGIRLMSGIQMEHSVALANRQRESRN